MSRRLIVVLLLGLLALGLVLGLAIGLSAWLRDDRESAVVAPAQDHAAPAADPTQGDAPRAGNAPTILVGDYLRLPTDRRLLLRCPEKPERVRVLSARRLTAPRDVPGRIERLTVSSDDDALHLLFRFDGPRAWLAGFAIENDSLRTQDSWFEPAVLLADGRVLLDGKAETTDVGAEADLKLTLGPFTQDVHVELSGTATVTWNDAEAVSSGEHAWDDVVTLDLALDLRAEAKLAGVPLERPVQGGVSGVLARDVGWVEIRDKRRYVFESSAPLDG